MVSVPEESSEAVIARFRDVPAALAPKQQSASLPLERTGQVVSLAGDIVRSRRSTLLVDHAEIVSEGESLKADEDSTEAASEPPEQDRAERASHERASELPRPRRRGADQPR